MAQCLPQTAVVLRNEQPTNTLWQPNVGHPLLDALQEAYAGSLEAMLQTTLQARQVLGRGSRAVVYAIPGMSAYILRVQSDFNGFTAPAALEWAHDPLPHVNIGQTVASL